jgi:hypothetical protein
LIRKKHPVERNPSVRQRTAMTPGFSALTNCRGILTFRGSQHFVGRSAWIDERRIVDDELPI